MSRASQGPRRGVGAETDERLGSGSVVSTIGHTPATGADLSAYVQHFRSRVVQDVLADASARQWLRRADAFTAARHRPGVDWPGRATREALAEQARRCGTIALACRQKATVIERYGLGGEVAREVIAELEQVA